MENLFRHAIVTHSLHVTDPSQLCPHEHRLHAIHFGTLQHFIVRDLVLPFDTHKAPEMPHVEGIQHFHMRTIARPGK